MIERQLAVRERSLFNLSPTVYLYDLTSTYFEGQALSNGKAKRGYSRDQRFDCKQVVIGLALGREGFPIAHEVFEGNLSDRKSLGVMLDCMDKRIGLQEGQLIVIDRGMAFDDNLAEITNRKLCYLVAARQSERDRWLAEFEESEGFEAVIREPSPLNPGQKKSLVKVKGIAGDSQYWTLCLSEGRTQKDSAIREKQQERLVADLKKLQLRIANGKLVKPTKIGEAIGRIRERYPRVARYYEIEYNQTDKQLCYGIKPEKYETAKKLDGSYLLRTNRTDLSAEEIWRIYSLLTKAEAAFRNLKSPLAERPIFHQLERRVETHIFLCVLALHLLVAIEHTLREQGFHTSWATVRDILSTHQVVTVSLPLKNGEIIKIRKGTKPDQDHVLLYELLKVPSQIIQPRQRRELTISVVTTIGDN